MAEVKANLSKQDTEFRDFALNGSMWSVMLQVCIPLALYQSLNQIFKILDSLMAAHISSESVSAVAYLSQINLMLSAIGGGLAVGASLQISRAYGSGDYKLVKYRVSSLYAICALIGGSILLVIVPFTEQFLYMANTPESMISLGKQYFIIELFGMVISFFNNVYISIERARGNSKRILKLNFIVLGIKLILTAFFVYVLEGNINMIAWATVISQVLLLVIAIYNIHSKDNAFGFSVKAVSLSKKVTGPMVSQSIPVIIEKVAFAFGKVIINSMCTIYGDLTVGALGISNNIGGMTTGVQNGFQEGGAAVISQNLGAGKFERALEAFKKSLIINLIIGVFGFSITMLLLDVISGLFAGNDAEFKRLIIEIYRFEAFGAVTLGINASVMALLYGLGKTKHTLLINFSRVFIFRVPVLWFLQKFTQLGSQSVGIVMVVSNVSIGAFSAIIGWRVIKNYRNELLETCSNKEKSLVS